MQCVAVRAVRMVAAGLERQVRPAQNSGKLAGKPQVNQDQLEKFAGNLHRDEPLAKLAGLRQARVGRVRVPHKPLLLLWLFGQFAATGSSTASYQQAEEPFSHRIKQITDFCGIPNKRPLDLRSGISPRSTSLTSPSTV